MAIFDYHIFNVSNSINSISLKRRLINPYAWDKLAVLIIGLPICIIFLSIGIIAESMKVIVLGGVLFLFWLILLVVILVKWLYYSNYPSSVEITQGKIIIIYRRLFQENENICITSKEQPFLTIDFSTAKPINIQYYNSKVTIHSMRARPIIIYNQLDWSKEDAVTKSNRFAELIASKSAILSKEKIFIHT